MNAQEIAIFTAIHPEARAVRPVIPVQCPLWTIGIRAGRLPDPAELKNIRLILLCGVAGALDPTLQIGDVVLEDPNELIPEVPLWRRGRIHTSAHIASSREQKWALHHSTGALAVDMEQSIVIAYAQRLGIPVIGLRTISDSAEDSLDPIVIQLVDDLGRAKPMKIAATLLKRPALIPHLSRLGKSTRIALDRLAIATNRAVELLRA